MRVNGFFLTIDSLLALALLFLAAGTLALGVEQSTGARNYGGLEALARDYLVLRYAQNASLNASTFNNLTGFAVNESAPGSSVNLSLGSRVYVYPFPLAACGCPSIQCNLTASVNATCLNGQESLASAVRRAWVTP